MRGTPIIVLFGPSGSGKTTLIKDIEYHVVYPSPIKTYIKNGMLPDPRSAPKAFQDRLFRLLLARHYHVYRGTLERLEDKFLSSRRLKHSKYLKYSKHSWKAYQKRRAKYEKIIYGEARVLLQTPDEHLSEIHERSKKVCAILDRSFIDVFPYYYLRVGSYPWFTWPVFRWFIATIQGAVYVPHFTNSPKTSTFRRKEEREVEVREFDRLYDQLDEWSLRYPRYWTWVYRLEETEELLRKVELRYYLDRTCKDMREGEPCLQRLLSLLESKKPARAERVGAFTTKRHPQS